MDSVEKIMENENICRNLTSSRCLPESTWWLSRIPNLDMTAVGDTLFFAANSGSGQNSEIRWNGSRYRSGRMDRVFNAVGDTLYFIRFPNFEGLWSQTVHRRTILVKDIFNKLTAVGDRCFRRERRRRPKLWRPDGASEGTFQVADINKNVGQDFDARGSKQGI